MGQGCLHFWRKFHSDVCLLTWTFSSRLCVRLCNCHYVSSTVTSLLHLLALRLSYVPDWFLLHRQLCLTLSDQLCTLVPMALCHLFRFCKWLSCFGYYCIPQLASLPQNRHANVLVNSLCTHDSHLAHEVGDNSDSVRPTFGRVEVCAPCRHVDLVPHVA